MDSYRGRIHMFSLVCVCAFVLTPFYHTLRMCHDTYLTDVSNVYIANFQNCLVVISDNTHVVIPERGVERKNAVDDKARLLNLLNK